jgi:superfamily II DNA or RNA helicase
MGTDGLRKPQIGAIHSISAHFTTSQKPGIVIMPTGSGKTAVLMMCPFILKANRVLVITPSKLVRNQIALGIAALQPIRRLGATAADPSGIRVKEVTSVIASANTWAELSNYNVIVSTPKCISPGIEGIVTSPIDFFDLVLIDEAHHAPAKSWIEIINYYSNAKRVLFTATPFRRDNKEIPGKIIYNYPISQAFEDGIFGATEFIAVNAQPGDDAAIARECERVHQAEPAGIHHSIMVRTDSKTRARELAEIYRNNTSLRLHLIHSDLQASTVTNTLNQLRNGQIDGIICIDMLGEGFDFPNLKLAAIHSPHKSLAATLQFIGRFTRVNAENITYAKFVAIPAEIEIERQYLYRTNAIWRQLIIELSETRIGNEVAARELMEGFQVNEDNSAEEFQELSLVSLEPTYHTKIYSLNSGTFDPAAAFEVETFGLTTIHREDHHDENISVVVLQEIVTPKWSKSNGLKNIANHLIVVYFDEPSSLLFINSSLKKSIELYDHILHSYCQGADGALLSDREINSVLANITEAEFFNVGMRNRSQYGTNESYRISTGPTAHLSIDRRDVNNFHRGHLMGKGKENGASVTIGLSSSSKVWSQKSGNLYHFVAWSQAIAQKINQRLEGRTNTPIDDLPTSDTVDTLPVGNIVAINLNESAFKSFVRVEYRAAGQTFIYDISDLQIAYRADESDDEHVRMAISTENFSLAVFLSYNYDKHITSENEALSNNITVFRHETDRGMNLIEYLNAYPLIVYYEDFSLLYEYDKFLPRPQDLQLFPQANLDDSIDWAATGVDIQNECTGANSIHEYLKQRIEDARPAFCYYDHGPGELADFITAELSGTEILVRLYHCKGSSANTPGNRVDDLYEVIGQAMKSLISTTPPALIRKLERRQRGKQLSGLCSNNVSVLQQFFTDNRGLQTTFEIVIVQPGITKRRIEDRISYLLSGTNSVIRNTNNCKELIAMTSV